MKTAPFFREHGHVITTRKERGWPWVLLLIVGLLAIYGFGQHLDDLTEARDQQLLTEREAERVRSFEAGRSQGHADMIRSAQTAWQAAHTEAERCRGAK